MNIRALLGRGREWLGRMPGREWLGRVSGEWLGRIRGDGATRSPGTFSLLALRMERDLQRQGRGHSIMVTAADDDEVGVESTVELGWCLAEDLGHSVLLVDGAFDVRALSAALGLAERPGLSELLDAEDQGSAALAAAVQPTLHERIFVLPHGSDAAGGAVRGGAVRQLLAAACERFDFVLVQGSLLVNGSRSMAFSSLVDATLLIAVEEQTKLDEVTRGQRLLNDCGATRVALVLANRPQMPRAITR